MKTKRKPSSSGENSSRSKASTEVTLSQLQASAETLTDRAYNVLEEMIVRLELKPGMAVSETMLSDMLGIGRTPIREALQRLARERLVQILPRRGIIVSDINVKAQLRLLEFRREVERLLARTAARRASSEERKRFLELAESMRAASIESDDLSFLRLDREFNDLCLQASRNEFAASAMGLMNSLSRRFWYLHYRQAADLPEIALLHASIAQAISEGNEVKAAKASDALLDVIEDFTRNTIEIDVNYK
jgi:DNA-binding GntR family transcriptional regulator